MKEEISFQKYRERGAYHWRNYFGGIFEVDCFLRGRYQVVIHLLKKATLDNASNVLEVGCGDGALSGLIYKTFKCSVTGVDPSPDGIKFSDEMFTKHNFKGSFEVSEGYRFNYPDGHFDFIVLADVIEHLQEPGTMLQELKRLLKDSGHLIITTPVRSTEFPEDKMHVREFYPHELVALCRKYFDEPVETVYSHPVVWHELYSYGRKRNRSFIRMYCRLMDKLFSRNVFFEPQGGRRWINFKQQGLLLRKTR